MNQIRTALAGKKSYLLAIATALYAILGYGLGYLDFNGMVNLLIGSGAIATLRAGIENAVKGNG